MSRPVPGYRVTYGKRDGEAIAFEVIGPAPSAEAALGHAAALLADARERDWAGQEPEAFAEWTALVAVETVERCHAHIATRTHVPFAVAGSRASKSAPVARLVEPGQIPNLTIRMATEALAAILATDGAFARAAIEGGACATLWRTWANSDPAIVRVTAESGAIECGPDEMASHAGRRRTCVLRARAPIQLSPATQVAAIHVAKATWAIDGGDRARHGSDVPSPSATVRAALAARAGHQARQAAERAARTLRGIGRPDAAEAILAQASRAR